MKIRAGFVSNSSSSSYIVAFKPESGMKSNYDGDDKHWQANYATEIADAASKGYSVIYLVYIATGSEGNTEYFLEAMENAGLVMRIYRENIY